MRIWAPLAVCFHPAGWMRFKTSTSFFCLHAAFLTFAPDKPMQTMKKLLFIFAAALAGLQSQAQESTFYKGDIVLNAGIGIGTTLYRGSAYSSTLPPVSLSGEYGLVEDFLTDDLTLGIGGYIGFAGSKFTSRFAAQEWGYRYNYTVIGGRAAVHYPLVDQLDTYGGVMLSYNHISWREIGNAPLGVPGAASGGLGLSLYVGGRYYFSENFAAMLELGYGITYLNIGVALKL